MVHKYAMALWLLDLDITSVQAVVRRRDLFMEPCAVIFEYEDPMVLGTMEVQYAPKLYMRSSYYGADEFFEITGDEGQIWVTRATGEMLDLPPVMLFTGNEHERKTTEFRDVDADWGAGFVRSSQHFVDSLVNGTPADMSPESAAKVLQLCFAVYQGLRDRRPRRPPHHHRVRHAHRVGRLVAQRRAKKSMRWPRHLVGVRDDADVPGAGDLAVLAAGNGRGRLYGPSRGASPRRARRRGRGRARRSPAIGSCGAGRSTTPAPPRTARDGPGSAIPGDRR